MPVQDFGDTDGWTAEPVDHDPFSSETNPFVAGNVGNESGPFRKTGFAGHIAATSDASHPLTARSLPFAASQPQESVSSYDPSWAEQIESGVGDTAESAGIPRVGAQRLGSTARTAAEFTPFVGNVLAGNEAYRAQQRGDPFGAVLHGAMAVPIPGASTEEGAARRLTPLGFYSHGADVAANLPQAKGTAEQMLSQLGKRGVKPEEMTRAGVTEDNLALPLFAKQPITREELAERFDQAMPKLQETGYGQQYYRNDEYGGGTKYDQYTLPGGQNYRELLLHLPEGQETTPRQGYAIFHASNDDRTPESPVFATEAEARRELERYPPSLAYEVRDAPFKGEGEGAGDYQSSHWDVPNVVAHLRMSDRKGTGGENLLHLEELQSDWGQEARKEAEVNRVAPGPSDTGVPNAPFIGSTQGWTDLGLKRALIEAARGNYDGLIWTSGADQAARYDLSKQISDLSYSPDFGSLQGRTTRGYRGINESNIPPEKLADYVGAETAKKLLGTPLGPHWNAGGGATFEDGWHTLSGLDLQTGGEGMKGYYDRLLPNRLATLTKKLDPDAKVGTTRVPGFLDLTPFREGGGQYSVQNRAGDFTDAGPRFNSKAEALDEIARRKAADPGKEFQHLPITPLMREKILKGLPQYKRGGRIAMADGGASDYVPTGSVTFAHGSLEPVDGDPFPPAPQVLDSDINRAKGFPEPRSPMHDRIAAASQDDHGDAPATGVISPEAMYQQTPHSTETLAHYAGNPEHAMPLRIGAAVGEEGKRMGQALWSAATAPGDVLTGKASMADPETQNRVIGLAASLPGGGPEAALGARGPVGAAAKAAKRAPAERELNTWNAETGQWEGPKPKMNPPEGVTYPPLFNLDPEVMNKVPDVPQFDLPRYDPPRGVSERMRDLVTNPDVRKQMIQLVRNGMQTVGLSWYNTGQLRAMFLKELGDTEGQQAFEKYMNLVSATSPENKIPQNIRTASHFYERDAQGVPPPERGDPIAQPYGSKAQKLHQQNVKNVLTEGYDVLQNPKPPSFVQNLMGNYAPGTMDRHAFKLPAMLSRDPRFLETSFTPEKGAAPVRPQEMYRNGKLTIDDAVNQPTMWAGMPNKNEYAALEGYYKSIADELGITPAQVQASAWVGGGHVTGLASAADETFLHSFQGRVFNTAHHTGQTPAEVVRKMIRGEQPLLAGGPGMAPVLPQGQARKEAQTSTAGAGALPPQPSDQELREHPFY